MFVLANMWFQTLMRQFFFSIDKIVFNFISTIYDFLITIARTSVLSQADIVDMANRVYKLLAIFMIFKVTFSLIMYVVNPDDFTDKNKGIGNLGTKIVMSLALLILTPYLFNYAYQLQTIILEDNSLSALIFGEDQMNSVESPFASAGDSMAYIVMAPFFAPNSAIDQLYECSQLTERDDLTGDIVFNKSCSGLSSTSLTSSDFACSSDANSLCALKNEKFSEQTLKNYVAGVTLGNIGLMFRQDMAIASSGDNFIIDYKYLFSTALGIVVVLLLISFCLDVALRSIKLAFLQLVAPIPILSYIDPKGGKDGMFKKWYEMCFKTYISLFIRLLAIYFAAYIISRIDRMVDIVDGSYVSNLLVKIFIIIGALMFAKQLPKILEGLGIKLDGGFTLNPLRKIEKEALGGGVLKKPNDMLAKTGKGILMSPFSGAALFGKKAIGALDAARHGKGLKQGWNRTHGKLYNNFYKKLDEWAPDSAEQRKNERIGREEVKQMNTKWNDGKKKADSLYAYARENGLSVAKPFDLLDGHSSEPYRVVYRNEEFIQSRMNLDKKDEERKILQRISDMTARGVDIREAIAAEHSAITKVGGGFADKVNGWSNMSKADASAKLTKTLEDTTKAVSGMEKVHESIRKQNPKDAATEDQLKFVKYNDVDPTNPSQAPASDSWES